MDSGKGSEMKFASRRRRPHGYLLVLVAVCASILTLSLLRLTASAAHSDDAVEAKVAGTAAYYAAESGLLAAEIQLETLKAGPPPRGVWFSGGLSTSTSRFKVEVQSDPKTPKKFQIRSTGQSSSDGEAVISIFLEATVVRDSKKGWTIVHRTRH